MSEEKNVFITIAIALAGLLWFLFRVHPAFGILLALVTIGFWFTFFGVIGILK